MFNRTRETIATLLLAAGIAGMATHCRAESAKDMQSHWNIGEPIVTYWAGPGDTMPVNERTAEQLVAGGWNLAWTKKPADLDLYHKFGVRVMFQIGKPKLDDPEQIKAFHAVVDSVSTHPALYAYYLADEPGMGGFAELARIASHLRRKDPAHLPFVNLFPTYASQEQLGVSADDAERAKVGYPTNFAGVGANDGTVLRYREYLKRFVEVFHPGLISYDHYHFLKDRDGAQYFLNLALIRAAAKEAGIPFLNIIQSCNSEAEGWREPGEHEVRWLTYTSLAYGAQGIAHFRYDIGLWKESAVVPTPLYWALCGINREFVSIARQLQPLKSLDVYHCGKPPLGGKVMPDDSAFRPTPANERVMLGLFGKTEAQATHVVVVNLDYKNASVIHFAGPKPMELFHPATATWTEPKAETDGVKLDLAPGGGALLRVK